VYDRTTGAFELRKGPIFSNIVLADEINRASPRTQAATLEAMNEGAVSIDGQTHTLDAPFMVIATQNPLDFEGVFPLPENQLDRFLMRISLGYPAADVEARLLDERPSTHALGGLRPALTREELLALQARADAVRLDPSLAAYVVSFAGATRTSRDLRMGLSPRGALALAQAARAWALMQGRDFCVPEDIVANVLAVCSHRVTPLRRAADGDGAVAALRAALQSIVSPA
jgi:MoxR-like ATPase